MPSEALRPTASAKEEHMKAIYLEEAVDRFIEQGANLDKDQIIYILNRLPYMEIVRCKDCKHWDYEVSGCKCNPRDVTWRAWRDDDFCSYGERSEDE